MEEGESGRGEDFGPGGNERGMGLRVRVLVKKKGMEGGECEGRKLLADV